ncbi:MAG TPA: ABC transporter permease [Actinomycetota bacterium]|nr:ABC transporter permease [Actinomycetota bacterium]
MELAASKWALWAMRILFVLLVVLLYVPIALLALFSFNAGDPSFPLEELTLNWYRRIVSNPLLVTALRRSAVVASISSLLAVALGVLVSFALVRRRFRGKPVVSAVVFSPLVIPYVVFGISLLVLFTAFDRFLTSTSGLFIGLGLHSVVIGHVVVSLPFTVLTIMPLLERLSTDYEEAARDLGASAGQTFRRVTAPLLFPALVSAFLIAFTLSFDEYAIASFLSGTTPTWPVYLFAQLRVPSQLPQLLAVSSIILVASIGLVVGAEFARRGSQRKYDLDT